MSAFSPEWLALREPADAAARAAGLVETLHAFTAGAAPRRLVDLGTGTGAALRYLAPRLGGVQRWRLVDADGRLLDAARAELEAWARRSGAATSAAGPALALRGADFACDVEHVAADLARGLDRIDWARGAIVSASALLDLVSAGWIDALVRACAARCNPAWLTLSYDGRIELDPADALDARIHAAFDRDQRRDKGFGPALGPHAARRAAAAFAAAGFEVATAPSDWVLGAESAALAAQLVARYADVAGRLEPAAAGTVAAWHARRAAQLERGALTLRVGHTDLLALPGEAGHGKPGKPGSDPKGV